MPLIESWLKILLIEWAKFLYFSLQSTHATLAFTTALATFIVPRNDSPPGLLVRHQFEYVSRDHNQYLEGLAALPTASSLSGGFERLNFRSAQDECQYVSARIEFHGLQAD